MNFIHSDLSYLYFVGHKFLDYTLNILKINECRNIGNLQISIFYII